MLGVALMVSGSLFLVGQAGRGRIDGAHPDAASAWTEREYDGAQRMDDLRALADQLRAEHVASQQAQVAHAAVCRDIVVPLFGVLSASEFFKCLVQEFQDNDEFQYVGDIVGTTDAQLVDFLTHLTLRGTWSAIVEATPHVVTAIPNLIGNGWSWLANRSPLQIAGSIVNAVIIEPLTFMHGMVTGTMSNSAEIIAAWSAGDGKRAGRAVRSIASGAPEALMFLIFDVSDYKDMAKLAYHGGGKLAGKTLVRNAPEVIEHAIPRKPKLLPAAFCFTAGTEVHAPTGLVRIEDVELGDRVLTRRGAVESTTAVDSTWRRIELEMEDPRSADGMLRIAMLRAPTWAEENRARIGALIDVDLREMQMRGRARITSIGEAPRIEGGFGRVVLSTIESQSANVLVLKFRGSDETLEPTFGHRLYSIDRDDWIEAGKLRIGERLHAVHGDAIIASITQKPGVHTVYNFEVEAEHEYLVGTLGVQSHNNNPCAAQSIGPEPLRPLHAFFAETDAALASLQPRNTKAATAIEQARAALREDPGLPIGLMGLGEDAQRYFRTEYVRQASRGNDALRATLRAAPPDIRDRFMQGYLLESELRHVRRLIAESAERAGSAAQGGLFEAASAALDDAPFRRGLVALGELGISARPTFLARYADHAHLGPELAMRHAMEQSSARARIEFAHAYRSQLDAAHVPAIVDEWSSDVMIHVRDPVFQQGLQTVPSHLWDGFISTYADNVSHGTDEALRRALGSLEPASRTRFADAYLTHESREALASMVEWTSIRAYHPPRTDVHFDRIIAEPHNVLVRQLDEAIEELDEIAKHAYRSPQAYAAIRERLYNPGVRGGLLSLGEDARQLYLSELREQLSARGREPALHAFNRLSPPAKVLYRTGRDIATAVRRAQDEIGRLMNRTPGRSSIAAAYLDAHERLTDPSLYVALRALSVNQRSAFLKAYVEHASVGGDTALSRAIGSLSLSARAKIRALAQEP